VDLKRLFYPRSVAVVGASPNMGGGGKMPYYQILKLAGYPGPIYPVNPAHREIDGQRVYASLEEIPESVDLAICLVPWRLALATVEAAARKGIGFLHFFTSGFSEIGNRELEESLVAAARKGGTRIVGPNCLGVHCAESRLTFDPTLKVQGAANVAFLGQSGGVTNNFTRLACSRKLGLNKAVSYGNQIDLRVEDFLNFLAEDDAVQVVAAYIEDIKDGGAFLSALARISPRKAVVILKGGVTEEGAGAAASHTGAMAGRHPIWSAVLRQHGCMEAHTEEQLVDLVMLATSEKIPRGTRLGYLGAGGGTSVLFADLAIGAGCSMPELSAKTQELISEKIPNVNTSTRNPVDLGAFGFNSEVIVHSMRAVDQEERIDVIVIYLSLDLLRLFETSKVESGLKAIAAGARELSKPVVPVLFRAAEDNPRVEQLRQLALTVFRQASLPMYNNLEEAVNAIRLILVWSRKRG